MSVSAEVTERLAALRRDYDRALPEKLARIRGLWRTLGPVRFDEDGYLLLQRLSHQLAGSGKTFGYPALSEQARALELRVQAVVEAGMPPAPKAIDAISALVDSLAAAATRAGPAAAPPPPVTAVAPRPAGSRTSLVYVVDDDSHMAEYLAAQLTRFGYSTRVFPTPAPIYDALEQEQPVAILMDISFPEGGLAGIDAVRQLRSAAGARIPVVFVSASVDTATRLSAVRAGGDAYLAKPVDPQVLQATLTEITGRTAAEVPRVLVVDDDLDLGAHYTEVLRAAGMQAVFSPDALTVIERVRDYRPDLLLLDLNMPGCNGLELAKAIRQEPRHATLPIVFVSADSAATTQRTAISLGVDDFLVKPVTDVSLVATATQQIQRARRRMAQLREVVPRDEITDLSNPRFFLGSLEQAVAVATDAGDRQGLIYLALDNVAEIRRRIGIQATAVLLEQAARALLQAVGPGPLVSQLSEAVFVVLAPPGSADQIARLGGAARQAVGNVRAAGAGDAQLECSLGIHLLGSRSRTVDNVLQTAARAALPAPAQTAPAPAIKVAAPPAAAPAPATGDSEDDLLKRVTRALHERAYRLVFQPIVNIIDTSEHLYEVRVRMVDEDGRIILPQTFLPIARKIEQAVEIDRWVIDNAVSAQSNDPRARFRASFFVKILEESLRHRALTSLISSALRNSRIKGHHRLVIEVDEQALAAHPDDGQRLIAALAGLDCGVLMDHFGSTKQALQMLAKFPVDYVKIHGPFVNAVTTNERVRTAMRTLVQAAEKKNVRVIVGGIESPEVLAELTSWGVRYVQGRHIQEPGEHFSHDFEAALL